MRKHVSKYLVMAALIIKAATIVIPNFSVPLLLTALIPLTVLGVVMFIDRNKSFSSQLPWVAAAALTTFYVLPLGPVSLGNLEAMLTQLMNTVSEAANNPWFSIGLVALIVLQLLFRKKPNTLLTIIRYAVALMVLLPVWTTAFPYSNTCLILILTCTTLCMVKELNGCVAGESSPSMLRCILVVLFLVVIGRYGGSYDVYSQITNLLQMDGDKWLLTTLMIFLTGCLVLLDDYYHYEKDISKMFQFHNAGWVMLTWCLMVIVMNIWRGFFHSSVLLIGIPFTSPVINSMLKDTDEKGWGWSAKFALLWFSFGVVLLMLAKSLNKGLLLSYVLIALLFLVWVSWKRIVAKADAGKITKAMGIAAIAILVSAKLTDLQQLQRTPTYLLGSLLGCLILCLLCGHRSSLERAASSVYEKEFQPIKGVQMTLSGLLLLVAVIKVLFAR